VSDLTPRLDADIAFFERYLKHAKRWRPVLLFCFGINAWGATSAIIDWSSIAWLQPIVVMGNIFAAVYGWHVLLEQERVMQRAWWIVQAAHELKRLYP
jgi:hypothetical protein